MVDTCFGSLFIAYSRKVTIDSLFVRSLNINVRILLTTIRLKLLVIHVSREDVPRDGSSKPHVIFAAFDQRGRSWASPDKTQIFLEIKPSYRGNNTTYKRLKISS